MDKKITGIIAYLSIVGWLIAYLAGDKENAKFHLNQGLVFAVAEIVLSILGRIPFVNIISGLAGIVLFVLWIIAFIGACQDQEKEAPLIGKIKFLK